MNKLKTSQRAALAVEALPEFEERAKQRQGLSGAGQWEYQGKASDQVADKFGVGARTVESAKYVLQNSPALFEKVKSGEMSVAAAVLTIKNGDSLKVPKYYLYRMFDANGRLLYIGMSGDVLNRWKNHACTKPWFDDVTTFTRKEYPSLEEVQGAETQAIRDERPLHNVAGAVGGSR